MTTKTRLIGLIILALGTLGIVPHAHATDPTQETENLVLSFPTLDDLESHMSYGAEPQTARPDSAPRWGTFSQVAWTSPFPSGARCCPGPGPQDPFSAIEHAERHRPGDESITSLLSDLETAQNKIGLLHAEIHKRNEAPLNKFFFDRLSGYARTDYGTEITGLFVNGIGFGTFEQALRQNYGLTYRLPLLRRYTESSNWKRLLSGWTISSSAGAEPQLNGPLQAQQLLNNLQLSWSVALKYDLSGATLRKIRDGQLAQESVLAETFGRAAQAREALLKKIAQRVEASPASPVVHDTRLKSLRELYPQFELYRLRYRQAKSCDDRLEYFSTMKGLALSLLTLAGYDRPDGLDLLGQWKKAHYTGCGYPP
jgi:hypothetical protein